MTKGMIRLTDYRIGIDFGTCYSNIGVCSEHGQATVFGSEVTGYGLPSIFYHDVVHKNLVGDDAEYFLKLQGHDPSTFVENVKLKLLHDGWNLQGGYVTPIWVASRIMKRLIEIATKEIKKLDPNGRLIHDEAVISVPVGFIDEEYARIEEAAIKAGIAKVKLILEPVAAAISYTYSLDSRVREPIFVYDLGGGTVDVVCLRPRGDLTYEIHKAEGERIGGLMWTERLSEYIVGNYDAKNLQFSRDKTIKNIFWAIEDMKKLLSSTKFDSTLPIDVPMFQEILKKSSNDAPNLKISRDQFEFHTSDLLSRTLAIAEKSTTSCGLTTRDRVHVVLSGGGSRMPQIKNGIVNMLKNKWGIEIINEGSMIHRPETAIARGAALVTFGFNKEHHIKNYVYFKPNDVLFNAEKTQGGKSA